MKARCHVAAGVALLLAAGRPVGAQSSPASPGGSATDCPVIGGVRVSVTARDTAGAPLRELVRIDRSASVDTTFRFDVSERRWILSSLAASAAAGLTDTTRGRWYFCAGAAVGLTRPTLVIRGARGVVRLRASLAELSRALERSRATDRSRAPLRRS